ncbi:MAG: hypothetical protein ACWA42_01325 [Lutibacter sp.]
MRLFFIIVTLLFTNSIVAQTCCSGGIPLSNSVGLSLLEKGQTQIGWSYDYNYLNTLNNGTASLNDNSRLRITHSILFNFNYAITANLSVEGLLTWVNQRRKITQFGNENLDMTSGIGDGVVLLKYRFKHLKDWVFGFGTKLPLGSSTKKTNEGITLNADLQPGSNAWDLLFYTSFLKNLSSRPSFSYSTKILYRKTGINTTYFGDSSYKFGNELQLYLSFSDQFVWLKTITSPSISFKYRNAIQDKIGGNKLENTGGNWIFLIPSNAINLSTNLTFLTKAEIPLYSNVEGTQLTPTYRITVGFMIFIKPKKNSFNLLKTN